MNYSDKTPADNHRPWEDHTVAIPDFSIRHYLHKRLRQRKKAADAASSLLKIRVLCAGSQGLYYPCNPRSHRKRSI